MSFLVFSYVLRVRVVDLVAVSLSGSLPCRYPPSATVRVRVRVGVVAALVLQCASQLQHSFAFSFDAHPLPMPPTTLDERILYYKHVFLFVFSLRHFFFHDERDRSMFDRSPTWDCART